METTQFECYGVTEDGSMRLYNKRVGPFDGLSSLTMVMAKIFTDTDVEYIVVRPIDA